MVFDFLSAVLLSQNWKLWSYCPSSPVRRIRVGSWVLSARVFSRGRPNSLSSSLMNDSVSQSANRTNQESPSWEEELIYNIRLFLCPLFAFQLVNLHDDGHVKGGDWEVKGKVDGGRKDGTSFSVRNLEDIQLIEKKRQNLPSPSRCSPV